LAARCPIISSYGERQPYATGPGKTRASASPADRVSDNPLRACVRIRNRQPYIYGYVFEVEWLGISTKTFWDWLVLLLPAAAAAIGVYWQVERTSLERREPGIADLRAQDEALQEYLDQMTQLLLERDLRNSASDSEVRYVARARTLTALDRLNLGTADAHRKRRIIQFLHELRLVQGSEPIISLHAADLSDADLHELDLSRINLWSIDLTGATGMTKSKWSSTPSHLEDVSKPVRRTSRCGSHPGNSAYR
jgi:hypothetical protein